MRRDPWSEWQRLWRAGTMMSETMTASHAVVGHRSKTIETAMCDPLRADHAELARMVSEKAAAFGAAGASLSRDWLAMQRDWNAQTVAMSAVMMGRLPGPRGAQAMIMRGQRLSNAALASTNRALKPIHAAATANARRLRKK